jgi:hypothetical protein
MKLAAGVPTLIVDDEELRWQGQGAQRWQIFAPSHLVEAGNGLLFFNQ